MTKGVTFIFSLGSAAQCYSFLKYHNDIKQSLDTVGYILCLCVYMYSNMLSIHFQCDLTLIDSSSRISLCLSRRGSWRSRESRGVGWVFLILVCLRVPSFPTIHLSLCFPLLLCSLCLLAVPHPLLLPHSFLFCFASVSPSPPGIFFTSVYSLFPPTCIHIPPMLFPFYSPSFPLLVFLSYPMEDLGVCKIYFFVGIAN